MVDNRTLDVYQYRILNSFIAINELLDVINKTLSGLFISDHNIDCCRNETLSILKNDDILNKYEHPLLNRLKFHLSKKITSLSEKKSLKYQLQYAIKKLMPNYLNSLIEELWCDITNANFDAIECHTNSLISHCVYNGWSARALFEMLRFFSNSNPLSEKWEEFVKNISSHNKISHDVMISASFEGNKQVSPDQVISTLINLGLDVKTYDELIVEYSRIPEIESALKKERKYIKVSVEAPDIYSAAHLGIKRISDKVNIASFYNLITAWDLKSTILLPINCATKYKKPLLAEELYKTYDYIDSSNKIFESTKKIFLDETNISIQNKLKGAFAYTNISRSSLFQEEKFMNIWVALESLSRTDMYSDIISNVKEILPSALCIRYIYRLVRNFAEDCDRCNVRFDFSTIKINIKQDSKQELVRQTISIFKDDLLYNELKSKCVLNRLLAKRCESIHRLLTDNSYTKIKIENHHQMIEWQIQRLYRIRNEITHSALQNEMSLVIYIEHLYDYLAVFISEIVTHLEIKSLNTLEEVYSAINDNYDVFIEVLKDTTHKELVENILNTGIIDLVI